MTEQETRFDELLRQIRAGSEEAVREFITRYGGHILRVIRRRLEKKLRPKFDSCDFLQDVLASFFTNPPPPETFSGPEAFSRYLTALARNKMVDTVRQRLVLQRYNVNRENSLDGSARFQAQGVAGEIPTPSEVAVANEQWKEMLQGQPPHYREILDLLRQGHTHAEIARKLNLSPKMVQRLVQRLQARFVS